MGLLDKFSEFRKDRQVKNAQKYGDTLKKVVTTKEQRCEAIEALADLPAEIAVPQLLKRFELVIDHGLQDNKEKERVTEIIVEHKDVSRGFVAKELETARRISWLIKVAEKIFEKDEYLNLLLRNLSTEFVGFDESVQDRNIELMLALRDFHDDRILEKIKVHLESRDESVKVAALECLEAQAVQSEVARKLLTDMLAHPASGDNARFLSLVKTTAQKHGWV